MSYVPRRKAIVDAVVLSTGTCRLYPRNRHAVGDADMEPIRDRIDLPLPFGWCLDPQRLAIDRSIIAVVVDPSPFFFDRRMPTANAEDPWPM